ncbi:hypothetical protein M5D96_010937, partial [Drosophila gunungcola]
MQVSRLYVHSSNIHTNRLKYDSSMISYWVKSGGGVELVIMHEYLRTFQIV